MPTVPERNSEWGGMPPDPDRSFDPYRIYNIGRGEPVNLRLFVEVLKEGLGETAEKNLPPIHPWDVRSNRANVRSHGEAVDYRTKVSIEEGLRRFAQWYFEYHGT